MLQHKLLLKQIKKYLPPELLDSGKLDLFLEAVNKSYQYYDFDSEIQNRAFELSEKEYQQLTRKLEAEVSSKRQSIEQLKTTILSIDNNRFVYNESDDLLYVSAYLKELLEQRKDAEQSLLESATLISSILQNLQVGILVEDENNSLLLCNDTFCKIFRINKSPEALTGLNCNHLANEAKYLCKHPDAFIADIEAVIKHGIILKNQEIEFLDGTFLERDFIPIKIDNQHKGHIWMYRDITEHKLNEARIRIQEEKYRRIISNMNLGLIEVDNDETIIFCNQSFCNMSGFEYHELIGKKTIDTILDPRFVDLIEEKRRLRKDGVSDSYEIPIRTKHGEMRWWLISGAPLYDENNIQLGSIGIHLDITEQKQLEDDLIEAKKAAEKSAKAKEVFLANMSHEIRTPMNAIVGMSSQLQKTSLTKTQESYIQTINTAADNLLVIINDILDFSKIEAGKIELEYISFSIRELISHTMEMFQLKAEEKGIALQMEFDERLADYYIGDPYRINQIITNLVSNAVKFTKAGKVKISCKKVYNEQVKTDTVEFKISDTGIGIDEHFLNNIFNKFSQEDQSVTRKYGGTGLGMSICKQLTELMGGNIHIHSKKGEGTTVIVCFNLTIGENIQPSETATEHINKEVLNGKHILLVEDNELNRMVAIAILSDYGLVITECVNGLEAIEYLKDNDVDLVLMDVSMPVMDGLEATSYIRNVLQKNSLPIVALTANNIKGEENKCIEAGMSSYVSKPYTETGLVNTMIAAIQKKVKNDISNTDTTSSESLYDISNIEMLAKQDEAFKKRILEVFCADATNTINKLNEAYPNKNFAQIRFVVHAIKVPLHTLNIHSLVTVATQIEKDAAEQNDSTKLKNNINTLISTLQLVIDDIQKNYLESR